MNAVYTSTTGWCALEFEKNANLAVYEEKRDFWDSAKSIQVIHYTLFKPWEDCGSPICDFWFAENASSVRPVAVVTAFYPGAVLHNADEYAALGRTLLLQDVAVVIFTDSKSSLPGLDLRNPNLTHVVEMDVQQFVVSHKAFDWEQQVELDPEKANRRSAVSRVELEKTNFVMHAIQLDIFKSSHYVWMDFDSMRHDRWGNAWTVHAERLPTHDRLLLLNEPAGNGSLVATSVFGGTVHAWRVWSRNYNAALLREARSGKFIGDVATVMSRVANTRRRLVCRVDAHEQVDDDAGSYLQYYLAGKVSFARQCHHHFISVGAGLKHFSLNSSSASHSYFPKV